MIPAATGTMGVTTATGTAVMVGMMGAEALSIAGTVVILGTTGVGTTTCAVDMAGEIDDIPEA
jgi:hypothetical protein